MRKNLRTTLTAAMAVPFSLLALTFTTAVDAAVIDFTVDLDCAQADSGIGTCDAGGSGTGLGLVTLDDQSNLLSWNLSWSGLSGAVFAAHFHGPATPVMTGFPFITLDTSTNPAIGSTTISSGQADILLTNMAYINIHTDTFTLGEIRGQVLVNAVPVPPAVWLFGSGLLGLIGMVRRK